MMARDNYTPNSWRTSTQTARVWKSSETAG